MYLSERYKMNDNPTQNITLKINNIEIPPKK